MIGSWLRSFWGGKYKTAMVRKLAPPSAHREPGLQRSARCKKKPATPLQPVPVVTTFTYGWMAQSHCARKLFISWHLCYVHRGGWFMNKLHISSLFIFYSLQFKTKMQIEIIRMKNGFEPRYRNVFHAGYVIFQQYGIRGVFQGLKATSMRDTPACGIYFGKNKPDKCCGVILSILCYKFCLLKLKMTFECTANQ